MKVTYPLLVGACLFISACSTTPEDIEGEQGLPASFVAQAPAEATYRRIVTAARACLGGNNATRIDADFFPDTREGVITIQLISPGSLQIAFGTIRVKPGETNNTQVDIRYKRRSGANGHTWVVHSARHWANGNAAYCSFDSDPL